MPEQQPNFFIQEVNDIFNECFHLITTKNADYSSSQDPLSTFRYGAEFSRMVRRDGTPDLERANRVRLADKLSRYSNLVDKELLGTATAPNHESLEDTLRDLINYFGAELAIRRIRTRHEALAFANRKEEESRAARTYATSLIPEPQSKPKSEEPLPNPVEVLQTVPQHTTLPLDAAFEMPNNTGTPLPAETDEDGWWKRLMKR